MATMLSGSSCCSHPVMWRHEFCSPLRFNSSELVSEWLRLASKYMCICLPVCQSVCLSVDPSVNLFVCLSVCLCCLCPSASLSVCLRCALPLNTHSSLHSIVCRSFTGVSPVSCFLRHWPTEEIDQTLEDASSRCTLVSRPIMNSRCPAASDAVCQAWAVVGNMSLHLGDIAYANVSEVFGSNRNSDCQFNIAYTSM